MTRENKYKWEYRLFRIAMILIQIIPYKIFLFFVRFFSSLAFNMLKGQKNDSLKNITIAFPEKSEKEKLYIARKSFQNLTTTFAEFAYSSKWKNEKIEKIIKVEGLDIFDEVFKRGGGLICITGHIGNWEFIAQIVSILGYNPAFMVRSLENKKINDTIQSWRTKRGASIIERKESDLREMFQTLRGGRPLAFLSDQNYSDGVFVPFFGKLAATASGAIAISMKTKSPIVIAYDRRNPDNTHSVIFKEEFIIEEKENKNQTLLHNTARYTKALENIIRENPTQWTWSHKRWQTYLEERPNALRYDKIDKY